MRPSLETENFIQSLILLVTWFSSAAYCRSLRFWFFLRSIVRHRSRYISSSFPDSMIVFKTIYVGDDWSTSIEVLEWQSSNLFNSCDVTDIEALSWETKHVLKRWDPFARSFAASSNTVPLDHCFHYVGLHLNPSLLWDEMCRC